MPQENGLLEARRVVVVVVVAVAAERLAAAEAAAFASVAESAAVEEDVCKRLELHHTQKIAINERQGEGKAPVKVVCEVKYPKQSPTQKSRHDEQMQRSQRRRQCRQNLNSTSYRQNVAVGEASPASEAEEE